MKRQKLAEYLKKSRELTGLSQAKVAKILGYTTPQFVSNWERGVSTPPFEALSSLLEIYDLNRNEVIEIILDEARENLEMNIATPRAEKKRLAA